MSNLVELKREYDRARRAELETDEAKAIINTHLELNGGDDVARTATDPEQRDEELKKIAKDVINEVNASHDAGLTAEGLNLVQAEILAQFAILRERVDAKFKELATSQEDALRDALQGVSKKLDTLVAEREKASETIGSGEKNILEQIEAIGEVVDANAAMLEYIESKVADLGGKMGAKMDNMEHRINVNTAKLTVLAKELHGSENNAPLANASVALEADTPTQTNANGQYTGKKKSKKSSTTNTAATTTTKGAKCMAILSKTGERCTKTAEAGFLTCRYQKHREQEEELRKKTGVPRVDSTASIQDTATNVNAQAPPTTQPSVAPRKSSRLKPAGLNKKRKRGDDEEELEHNHLPGETREDCRACAMGCGDLTQPTGSILHSERADQRDYRFESPEPENQVAHGFPPSPPINGPIHNIPSPTSTEADRLEAEQTGFRNREEVEKEIERLKSQQNQHGVRMKQPTKPGTGPDRFFREAPRRNAGSNW
jgi:hypothetical protein